MYSTVVALELGYDVAFAVSLEVAAIENLIVALFARSQDMRTTMNCCYVHASLQMVPELAQLHF